MFSCLIKSCPTQYITKNKINTPGLQPQCLLYFGCMCDSVSGSKYFTYSKFCSLINLLFGVVVVGVLGVIRVHVFDNGRFYGMVLNEQKNVPSEVDFWDEGVALNVFINFLFDSACYLNTEIMFLVYLVHGFRDTLSCIQKLFFWVFVCAGEVGWKSI